MLTPLLSPSCKTLCFCVNPVKGIKGLLYLIINGWAEKCTDWKHALIDKNSWLLYYSFYRHVYVQTFMHLWHHLGHQFPFWLDNSPILSFPWDSELLLIMYLWCPSCHNIVHKLEWHDIKLCAVWVTWALLKDTSLQSTIIKFCILHNAPI